MYPKRIVGTSPRRGFTLVELLTVIAIIAILALILIPLIGKIRMNALAAKSTSNLRQIYIAHDLYRIESNGYVMLAGKEEKHQFWGSNFILPYLGIKNANYAKAYIGCPVLKEGDDNYFNLGYGMNGQPGLDSVGGRITHNRTSQYDKDGRWTGSFKMDEITFPESRMFFCVANEWQIGGGSTKQSETGVDYTRYGGNTSPVVFFDGHTDALTPDQMYLSVKDPRNFHY